MKVKLGDKVGMVPDNFVEVKKEAPKVPTPPLPSREELPPPAVTKPAPKENEVFSLSVCTVHVSSLMI